MALLNLFILFLILVIATLWKHFSRREKIPQGLKKLPGPKGWPIIGSVPEVPEELGWIKFADWGKEYGDIYQVNLAGTNHVWISSDQVAHDLLSKKGAIYSDRPHIPALIDDNRTSAQYLPLLSRNEGWTRQRKFANNIMRESERADFGLYPELEAIRMCVELMAEPEKYNHALESFVARVTSRLAWGHSEASDELKQRARELLIGVSPTGALGNKIPFVMSLPDWLSPAKAWERRRAKTERAFFNILQQDVRNDIEKSNAPSSWMKFFFDNVTKTGFTGDLEGAYAVGMHGIAGALTIAAPMQAFCLAMCHYPQHLARLQEELDRVCGDRMPAQADKPNLPFLRACIREVIRWRPPVPTGIPHYLIEDDVYNGYHVPKGSVMHPLEWSISRDPRQYPDPETFNPLRWIEPEYPTYKEPLTQYPSILNMTQFGYGRRTCQGQTVSEADLLVGIGSIAWLFNLSSNPPSPMKNQPELPPTPPSPCSETFEISEDEKKDGTDKEQRRKLMSNKERTISQEELLAGLSAHGSDGDEDESSLHTPGSYPHITQEKLSEKYLNEDQSKKPQAHEKQAQDPTLVFSTLLIAKPLPFKFNLSVRNRSRAEHVMGEFVQKRMEGEFRPGREYWGPNQGSGKELGWGKV